ncbi:MAG: c-type cytochrome [Planctomycetaceae bacterium]|nr:c-type cytochrome [Planctomycetaceae bacterium]
MKIRNVRQLLSASFLISLVTVLPGCTREEPPRFYSMAETLDLPVDLQLAVQEQVQEISGTFETPHLVTESVAQTTLKLGQQVYQRRCVQCHGVTGDGQGPVAAAMYPRPRDYRKGVFKFTSTPYGSKPLRSDLVRTVTIGVRGTSMPSFKELSSQEIEAVVDYVLALTQRGELEAQITSIAEFDEEVDPEVIQDEVVPVIESQWNTAKGNEIVPMTTQPVFTMDHVKRGKEAFLSKGCSKCHGDDGRGQTKENLAGDLKDTWGHVTRAADLTSGMLHGGQRPIDVYKRIYAGINGTPMPGFANAFKEEPDTIWDLVAFVLSVSNRRRMGERPAPGPISPYIPAGSADAVSEANAAE